MYDWPEVRAATDALWAAVAERLGVPGLTLTRAADYAAAWAQPTLLFSQTCGYPFTHAFRSTLTYVATPHYAADGCAGPTYCSLVMARTAAPLAAFRGQVAAFNGRDSMSGMLALKAVFAPHAAAGRYFGSAVESGSHVRSLELVQAGAADVCAVDAVCVGLARRHRPALLDGLVEVARSPAVPGLPFVTRAGDVQRLRDALAAVLADPALADARDALLLTGASVLDAADYDAILRLEQSVDQQGGLVLW